MNLRFSLMLIFLITLTMAFGQSMHEIDSVQKNLKNETVDSVKIKLYLRLGILYSTKDPIISKSYLDSGYYLAQERHYDNLIAIATVNYGFFYYYTANYAKALESNLLASKYFESRNDTVKIISTITNIGLIHYSQKHYTEALSYFNKALKLDKSAYFDKKSQKRIVMNNIANTYWKMKQYDLAKTYYKKSIELAETLKDNSTIGSSSTELGELYLEIHRMDSAIYFLNKGMEARKQINDNLGLAGSYKSLAKYNMQLKKYDSALENLQNALELSEKTGYLRLTSEIYFLKSSIYKELNNYELAYKAYQNFKSTDDSIFNERITRELAQQEMQYEFDKKERLSLLERKQADLKQIILVFVLFSIIVIAFLLYFLSRSNNKRAMLARINLELEKKNLEQDLDLKNKELTTNIMYLISKNELINNISDRLMKLQSTLKQENQGAFQNILSDLQSGVDNKVWAEFEYRFLQVHNDFYDKLRIKFPDLTPAEIKLCAFLRLNISSKDISAITRQHIKSIEVARSRLRKKLNINNMDINLVNFLMDI